MITPGLFHPLYLWSITLKIQNDSIFLPLLKDPKCRMRLLLLLRPQLLDIMEEWLSLLDYTVLK